MPSKTPLVGGAFLESPILGKTQSPAASSPASQSNDTPSPLHEQLTTVPQSTLDSVATPALKGRIGEVSNIISLLDVNIIFAYLLLGIQLMLDVPEIRPE
jgi:hypothetical protein